MPVLEEAIVQHVAATLAAMSSAAEYTLSGPTVLRRGEHKVTAADPSSGQRWTPSDGSLVLAALEGSRLDEPSGLGQVGEPSMPARWRMVIGVVYHVRVSHDDASAVSDAVMTAAKAQLIHALTRERKRGGLAKDTQPVRWDVVYEPASVELEIAVDYSARHEDLMSDVAVPAVGWAA